MFAGLCCWYTQKVPFLTLLSYLPISSMPSLYTYKKHANWSHLTRPKVLATKEACRWSQAFSIQTERLCTSAAECAVQNGWVITNGKAFGWWNGEKTGTNPDASTVRLQGLIISKNTSSKWQLMAFQQASGKEVIFRVDILQSQLNWGWRWE